MPSSADDRLADIVATTTPEAIDALVAALSQHDIDLRSSAVGIAAVRGLGQEAARKTATCFQALTGQMDEAAVALALATANRLRKRERLSRPEIEIVWTGPPAPGTIMRTTAAVVEDMLREARTSGEVLIVGYSLTAPDGSLMKELLDLLATASRGGATVTFVLHRDDQELNKANLLQAWSVFARKPKVLTWQLGRSHPYTKLHAKALVVDRLDLLVTSANLTFHGLESNLELGLRVRGPQAAVVAERFDQLEAEGVLEPWLS